MIKNILHDRIRVISWARSPCIGRLYFFSTLLLFDFEEMHVQVIMRKPVII